MPSKETILAKIKANRPNLWPLPDVPIFETLATDKKKLFIQILERGGSKVHCIDDSTQIHQVITTHFPEDKSVRINVSLGLLAKLFKTRDRFCHLIHLFITS